MPNFVFQNFLLRAIELYTDQELWLEVKEGNKNAFDELINRYWKILYNSAYKRIQMMDVCQDIVQDIFLYLWQKRAQLDIESPENYLKTSVKFRVYSYYSRNKTTSGFTELFGAITTSPYKAENKLLHHDLQELVSRWIDTLPPKRKEVFRLYLEKNMTTKEIAEELQISQKTVQNQLNLSFDDLRNTVSKNLSLLLLFF